MNRRKRFLSMLLVLVTLISIMSVTASAANTENKGFYDFSLFAYHRFLNPQDKLDDSPCYVWIREALVNQPVYIRAYGFSIKDKNTTFKENLTRDGDGNVADHVIVQPFLHYRIRSMINEFGYPYASLAFYSPDNLAHVNGTNMGNEVSGYWSPDSAGSYQFAYD